MAGFVSPKLVSGFISGNKSIHKWFAKEVVVIFIEHVRTKHSEVCKVNDILYYTTQYSNFIILQNNDCSPKRALCYCDAEQIQIETFLEDHILECLANPLIDLGKSPASCSATCQSFDAISFFIANKKITQGYFFCWFGRCSLLYFFNTA
jgi:hypothetical protein